MTHVRIDKWLWAARFFKTRSLASRACELGRIEANGQPAKASREVRVGDLLHVKNDGGDFQVEVLVLSAMPRRRLRRRSTGRQRRAGSCG
jgi:ribosome-associated heat shock protein Hsp15